MSAMTGKVGMKGKLTTRANLMPKAPISWRIRNRLRWGFIRGWMVRRAAFLFTRITGVPILLGRLRAVKILEDGTRVNYGVLSYRSLTTVFCEDMVDELIAETSAWGDYKFHDSGVGVTAENITDTDMETTDGESRVTGTQVESTSVIYESVGTITYTSTKAITEHGVFNIAAAGILMDRSQFAAINVINTESIEFTYDLTVTAGG